MPDIRILHVSFSDVRGGAAIAAGRLVRAQRNAGFDAEMLVVRKHGDGDFVREAEGAGVAFRVGLAGTIARRTGRMLCSSEPGAMRTFAMVPTGIGALINRRAPDIVHWHWVGGEMISLTEMALVNAPGVWTLHDQWAFCGAEHYANDRRFAEGYGKSHGLDVDAWTFRRKQAEWCDWKPVLVCPSHWMAQEAQQSLLMGDLPATVIPNTLDTDCFRPHDLQSARAAFGLPADAKVFLFGADGGTQDPRKGFDLLTGALERVPEAEKAQTLLVTFGGAVPSQGMLCGIRHTEVGKLVEDERIAQLYAAADLFIAPSRQDNLPNTMVEAQACGTPCLAFRIGGMADIIAQPRHGRLIEPFDIEEMARAMVEVAHRTGDETRQLIRTDAVERFGQERVVGMHSDLYSRIIGRQGF